MNRRERVIATIERREVDHIPYNFHGTSKVYDRACGHYGIPDTETLLNFTGNHIAKIGGDFNYNIWAEAELEEITATGGHAKFSSDATELHTDEFRCVWNRAHSGPFPVAYPLADDPALLDTYEFPDPNRPGRFDVYQDTAEKSRGKLFLFGKLGFNLFERAWSIRGFSQIFSDMIERPEFVEELLDRILYEWNLPIIDGLAAFGLDGFYFCDDYGSQKGMLFSPEMWRKFIKPRLAICYQRAKDHGLFVGQHSDGNMLAIMPDLIEIGLDIFNPVSPQVYDPDFVKDSWGEEITLFGGIDVEETLPFGTPAEVRAEIQQRAKRLGMGGGYILQSSHTMLEDIPIENIIAYIEACHELAGIDTQRALEQALEKS